MNKKWCFAFDKILLATLLEDGCLSSSLKEVCVIQECIVTTYLIYKMLEQTPGPKMSFNCLPSKRQPSYAAKVHKSDLNHRVCLNC